MTLYIGGIDPETTKESDVRDQFYSYGEIASVRLVPAKTCAFVTFTTRSAAERAMEEKQNMLFINGQKLRLMWGKPKDPVNASGAAGPSNPHHMQQQQGMGGGLGGGGGGEGGGLIGSHDIQAAMGLAGAGLGGSIAPNPYSSMDPQQMGTRIEAPADKAAGSGGKKSREHGEEKGEEEHQAKKARGGGGEQGTIVS